MHVGCLPEEKLSTNASQLILFTGWLTDWEGNHLTSSQPVFTMLMIVIVMPASFTCSVTLTVVVRGGPASPAPAQPSIIHKDSSPSFSQLRAQPRQVRTDWGPWWRPSVPGKWWGVACSVLSPLYLPSLCRQDNVSLVKLSPPPPPPPPGLPHTVKLVSKMLPQHFPLVRRTPPLQSDTAVKL